MKNAVIISFFTLTCYFANGQVSGSSPVPNSGANTTLPPTNTYPMQDNMSNPTNSTVPGPTGSYSVDPGKPDINNPNTMGSYTVSPGGTGGTTTFSPQTGTSSQQRKNAKK